MKEKQLFDLKQDIDDAKTDISKSEGRRDHSMDELKKKWNCKSLEESKKKLKELQSKIDDIDIKIAEGLKKLEESYNESNTRISEETGTTERRTRPRRSFR